MSFEVRPGPEFWLPLHVPTKVLNHDRQNKFLPLKDVQAWAPGTCEYATLHGKRDFAYEINIMHLKQGDYSGLSG
jgi:hypothetical protein